MCTIGGVFRHSTTTKNHANRFSSGGWTMISRGGCLCCCASSRFDARAKGYRCQLSTMLRRTLLSKVLVGPAPGRSQSLLLASSSSQQRNSSIAASRQLRPPLVRIRRRREPSATSGSTVAPVSTSSTASSTVEEQKDVRDTIIIGSGPAGYTAGRLDRGCGQQQFCFVRGQGECQRHGRREDGKRCMGLNAGAVLTYTSLLQGNSYWHRHVRLIVRT